MSRHTPGSWRIATNYAGKANHIVGDAYTPICSFGVTVRRNCCSAAIEHNARLIAAAPELLEALTDCVEHMHWTQPQGEAALKKAKAAIAKATRSEA